MNTVTVKINGVDYNLRGKEDEKYLFDVAAYVDTKIKEISGSNKKLSTSSAAVLTAVNIADELFKCDLEIGDITKKKNSLEERHLTLKERLRELKVEIDETAKNRASEIETLKNIIFSMEEKLKESQNIQSLFEELNKKYTEVCSENNNQKNEIKKLENQLKLSEIENNNLNTAIKNCTEEINSRVAIEEYNELNSKLQINEKENDMLLNENNKLKEQISQYTERMSLVEEENDNLKEVEKSLKSAIEIKEAEVNEYKNSREKELIEENDSLKSQISIIEADLKKSLSLKESLIKRNKEISFRLQNYNYKVLDLEKKLNDAQFNLALEKKNKNPLLR